MFVLIYTQELYFGLKECRLRVPCGQRPPPMLKECPVPPNINGTFAGARASCRLTAPEASRCRAPAGRLVPRLVPLLRSRRPTPLGRAAAFPPEAGPKAVRGPEWGWGGGEREAWRQPGGQEGKLRLSQCFPSLWTPRGVSQRKVFLIKVWEFLDFLDICL